MRIKIKSEGKPHETEITTEEGTILSWVRRATWSIDARDGAECQLELDCLGVGLEISSQCEFLAPHPNTGEMKAVEAIVFKDGTMWSDDNE